MNDESTLLIASTGEKSSSSQNQDLVALPRTKLPYRLLLAIGFLVLSFCGIRYKSESVYVQEDVEEPQFEDDFTWTVPLLGLEHTAGNVSSKEWTPPEPQSRCNWVAITFRQRDEGEPEADLRAKYAAQTEDLNVFYRATAHIFWQDFVLNGWGEGLKLVEFDERDTPPKIKGFKLTDESIWTWVTGDQHLSNFGAWRNRNRKVVFSVNDFDEAAIYDFQIDVLRIAVSVLSHAYTNGYTTEEIDKILSEFTKSYIKTVISYVGNENALLFELTKHTSFGVLREFLNDVDDNESADKQLSKFTTTHNSTDAKRVVRRFIKGPSVDIPHEKTHLAPVHAYREKQIRDAFTSSRYGATMMYLGWAVPEWDPTFFEVLDVAARIGSGVGSYGVNRYYVLLKGTDKLLDEGEGGSVILDVKYEPPGAVTRVLTLPEKARYDILFRNEAARVVEAQRKLTSFVDPFIGWIYLPDVDGVDRPFYVRQRSPWKDDLDIDAIKSASDFEEYIVQIAAATATSHTRGTVAKAPGEFKHAVKAIFRKKRDRDRWGKAIAELARAYRKQVELDFECFREFVETNYS